MANIAPSPAALSKQNKLFCRSGKCKQDEVVFPGSYLKSSSRNGNKKERLSHLLLQCLSHLRDELYQAGDSGPCRWMSISERPPSGFVQTTWTGAGAPGSTCGALCGVSMATQGLETLMPAVPSHPSEELEQRLASWAA